MAKIIDAQLVGIQTDQHTIALVVEMEDEQLHTDEHPFCDDILCPCHMTIDPDTGNTTDYYLEHIRIPYQAGLLSRDEKERIYNGWHI